MGLFKGLLPIIYFGLLLSMFVVLSGRPKIGLLFLAFFFPLQSVIEKFHALPLGTSFHNILLCSILIGLVAYKGSKNQDIFSPSPFNAILAIYICFTYVSLWQGSIYLNFPAPINFTDSRVQDWKNYIVLPIIFFLSYNILEDKKDLRKILIVVCCTMFYMNLSTVRQISWITSWVNRPKISGTFAWLGPNEVAAFYATYTLVLVGLLICLKEKRWKIFLSILVAINLYCDLFLFSRGAYAATLMGLLLISIIRKRMLIIPLILILVFWQQILPKEVVERLEFTQQADGKIDHSAQQRLDLWDFYLKVFQQNPILGVGFMTATSLNEGKDTHNIYVRTLADTGVVGLGFLLGIFFIALRRAWRLYSKSNDLFLKGLGLGFCGCVVAVMVGNFFGDRWSYLPLSTYFWLFLGVIERGNVIAINDTAAIIKNKAVSQKRKTIQENLRKKKTNLEIATLGKDDES